MTSIAYEQCKGCVGGCGSSLKDGTRECVRERDLGDEVLVAGVDGLEIFGKQGVAEMKWTS